MARRVRGLLKGVLALLVAVVVIGSSVWVVTQELTPGIIQEGETYYVRSNGDVVIALNDRIDSTDLNGALMALRAANRRPNRLLVIINSPGGAVFEALSFISLMSEFRHVTTRVVGVAASGAFLVFLHGNTRIMDENSYLMWHSIQVSPLVVLTEPQKAFLNRLQDALNRMVMRVSCWGDEAFNIPFKSEREVWLDRDMAQKMCFLKEE